MVCGSAGDAAAARAALAGGVEIVELPVDDSWLRDSGPVFVVSDGGTRAARALRLQRLGEKFHPYDNDAAIGRSLARRASATAVCRAPFVLEGGSIAVDGAGTLLTTEQCLLNPNRNPGMSRAEIEQGLRRPPRRRPRRVARRAACVEDRDTDGHVDLIACFTAAGRAAAAAAAARRTPTTSRWRRTASAREAAGLDVITFEPLARARSRASRSMHSYLNFYVVQRRR